MSNFNCPECGTAIVEGDGGHYVTGCEHYPLEKKEKHFCQQWDDFRCRLGPGKLCVGCVCLDCSKQCEGCKERNEKLRW